jgi:hypothetical protein
MNAPAFRNASRSLGQLTKAQSWRVLNLASLKPSQTPIAKPFFHNRKLERAIFVKHNLRWSERNVFLQAPEIATKIIVPFNPDDLSAGGYAVFVGENRFLERLSEVTGIDCRGDKPEHRRDLAVIDAMSTSPTLDPFVLRHLLQDSGFDIDERYFNIDVEQIMRMNAKLIADLKPLVSLAMGREPSEHDVTTFVDNVFRKEPQGQGLAFLKAVSIEVAEWPPLLFSWKAALVAEDSGERLVKSVKDYIVILKELMILRSNVPEVNAEINRRKQVLAEAVTGYYKKCRANMEKFGAGGRDQIIRTGQLGQMKDYLRSIKNAVRDYSLSYLQIDQCTSMIQFYFADKKKKMQPVTAQDFIDVTNPLMELCTPPGP